MPYKRQDLPFTFVDRLNIDTMIGDLSTSYVTLELRVQWGNINAAKHVNNTVYVLWIESARRVMFGRMHGGDFEFKKTIPILA